MYNLPSTYSYLGYLAILSALICQPAKSTASNSFLSAVAHYDVPPGSTRSDCLSI